MSMSAYSSWLLFLSLTYILLFFATFTISCASLLPLHCIYLIICCLSSVITISTHMHFVSSLTAVMPELNLRICNHAAYVQGYKNRSGQIGQVTKTNKKTLWKKTTKEDKIIIKIHCTVELISSRLIAMIRLFQLGVVRPKHKLFIQAFLK